MPDTAFKAGGEVMWDSSGGHSVGKVLKKLTAPTRINGHEAAASRDNAEYLVESGKSGGQAAPKPSTLEKA